MAERKKIPEDTIEPTYFNSPERNLLASVIQRAICDAYDKTFHELHVRVEARGWLESTLKTPFSFLWACSILELNPKCIRQAIHNGTYRFEVNGLRYRRKH